LSAEGLSLAFDLVIAQIDETNHLVCFQTAIPWLDSDERLLLQGKTVSATIKACLLSQKKDAQGNPLLAGVVLRGFWPDEEPLTVNEPVQIVDTEGITATGDPIISKIEQLDNALYFAQGIPWETACEPQSIELILQGKQARMVVEQGQLVTDERGKSMLVSVVVRNFAPGDLLSVIQRDQPRRRLDFLPIEAIETIESLTRIYVPDDHLVVSGLHEIKLAPKV
jgi:hypothetical protein